MRKVPEVIWHCYDCGSESQCTVQLFGVIKDSNAIDLLASNTHAIISGYYFMCRLGYLYCHAAGQFPMTSGCQKEHHKQVNSEPHLDGHFLKCFPHSNMCQEGIVGAVSYKSGRIASKNATSANKSLL